MASRLPSPKFRLSAVTLLLTDYINRFAELKTRPEIYRCYESVLRLVSGYREIILDPHGMILSWNDFFSRITRFSEEEILGQHIGLLYLPHDRQDRKPEALLAAAVQQGISTCFGQFARKDGATFQASLKMVTVMKKKVHLGFTLSLRTCSMLTAVEVNRSPGG
jgi:PAS domain S-box-containing protein